MREIKFRAWDEANKIMHNNFQFIRLGEESNDWIVFISDRQSLKDKQHPFENPYFQQQLKIMQFTGLKDKNGKEIYEGDIIKAMKGEQEKSETFYPIKDRVRYWNGSFEIFGKTLGEINTDNSGNAKNIKLHWSRHHNTPDIYEEINSIEIIGNIYENPELL